MRPHLKQIGYSLDDTGRIDALRLELLHDVQEIIVHLRLIAELVLDLVQIAERILDLQALHFLLASEC